MAVAVPRTGTPASGRAGAGGGRRSSPSARHAPRPCRSARAIERLPRNTRPCSSTQYEALSTSRATRPSGPRSSCWYGTNVTSAAVRPWSHRAHFWQNPQSPSKTNSGGEGSTCTSWPPRWMSQAIGSLVGVADADPLAPFSPAVRAWFETSFPEATPPQAQGWPAIAEGHHSLILAPTGSGKTLAAFLWAIDRLVSRPDPGRAPRTAPGCSTSRRCGRWPSTSRRTCAARSRASAWPPSGSGCRTPSPPSGCAPATRRPTSAASSSGTRPTSSSPRPSRCT